jgi:hypothetical protein
MKVEATRPLELLAHKPTTEPFGVGFFVNESKFRLENLNVYF